MEGYAELIQKVKKVNRQAALILARRMPLDAQRNPLINIVNSEYITGAFLWQETPQNKEYWSNINYLLRSE
jgi:hypothetical protein